jgi:hypothetical protein
MNFIVTLDGEVWGDAEGVSILCVTEEAIDKLNSGGFEPKDLNCGDIISETILHFP